LNPLTEPLPGPTDQSLAALFDAYRPVPGTYDEMKSADGQVRPHWQKLVDALRSGHLAGAGLEAERFIGLDHLGRPASEST
jgi:hypothetical protein